jgi:LmbE family N-acetylglucosaminyl deacetylase
MKSSSVVPPEKAIPERRIVVLSPHFDDIPCMLGGWLLAMRDSGALAERELHFIVVFSRSNYTARAGDANYDASPERIRFATGTRIMEDNSGLDELVGAHRYRYELGLEDECLVRGGKLSDPEFEYPHGTYEDFDAADRAILERVESRILSLLAEPDTAVVVPAAYREHKDHFIVREAARRAYALASKPDLPSAALFFQEDKPYAGLADAQERERVESFAAEDGLRAIFYAVDSEAVAALVERHYPSQFEEVYRKGIVGRGKALAYELGSGGCLDRILTRTGK